MLLLDKGIKMKPKEIQKFFDSSVRKLKKIYGMEASTVSVAAPTSWSHGNNMAVCVWEVDWKKCELSSALAINARHYAELIQKYKLDEEVSKISVANTACHEMAHHLVTYREIRNIRNEWCHEGISTQVIMLKLHLSYIHQGNNAHGTEWQEIMEEMGADPTSGIKQSWKPVFKIPTIFNGRL